MIDTRRLVLTGRDRAVLRAIASDRCQLDDGPVPVLRIDGIICADPAVGRRLLSAGLISSTAPGQPMAAAVITAAGRAALAS
jgi:hypothetical protein